MALTEAALKNNLLSIFKAMGDGEPMSTEEYAEKLAKAITGQIRTAEIPSGTVIVPVTGTAVDVKNMSAIKVG